MKIANNVKNDLRIQVLKRNLRQKKKDIRKHIRNGNCDTTIEQMMQLYNETGRMKPTAKKIIHQKRNSTISRFQHEVKNLILNILINFLFLLLDSFQII